MKKLDPEQERELDEALAQARAAFADKSEEQILDEVVELIHQMREARRNEAAAKTSALSQPSTPMYWRPA